MILDEEITRMYNEACVLLGFDVPAKVYDEELKNIKQAMYNAIIEEIEERYEIHGLSDVLKRRLNENKK